MFSRAKLQKSVSQSTLERRELSEKKINWTPVGHGKYNEVFKSDDQLKLVEQSDYAGPWVKRHQLVIHDKKDDVDIRPSISSSTRALRVFKQINPSLPAALFEDECTWIAPFIDGAQASDEQILQTVIHIYLRTRRILLDGCGRGNVLFNGVKGICVDTDVAVRPGSPASDDYAVSGGIKHPTKKQFIEGILSKFKAYWGYYLKNEKPKTVSVIKSLLYLEYYLSEENILDKYITPAMLDKITAYRLAHKVIDKINLEDIYKTVETESETPDSEKTRHKLKGI